MKTILTFTFLITGFLYAKPQASIISVNHGTSILVVTTQNKIWVAADSRGNKSNTRDSSSFTECKIGKNKNIFFATAGRFTALNGEKGGKEFKIFDIDKVLYNSIEKTKTLDDAVSYAVEDINKSLNEIIASMKLKNKDIYKAYYGLIFKSAVFTFENRINKIITIQVTYNNDSLKIDTASHIGKTGIQKLGFFEVINKHLKEYPSYFDGFDDMKNKLEFLIKLEAVEHPYAIGLPIDVLEINNDNNFKWLTQNSGCF